MPASGIAWIASSNAEIASARDALRLLSPEGVLDELGFLVILGGFSDRLYPGTNTIMTRARYLVFLPAIFRYIERHGLVKSRAAESVSRDFQFQLCEALTETEGKRQGVIGIDRGWRVARPPSNIYWNALADLGIATCRIGESSYLDRLASQRSQGHKDDDGISHDDGRVSIWDDSFPTAGLLNEDGRFSSKTSFALQRREASHLQRRFESLSPAGRDSLLSHTIRVGVRDPDLDVSFAYPWDVPDVTGELAHIIEQARLLSLCARGMYIQYQAMLIEARRDQDPGAAPAFSDWWRFAKRDLARWDVSELFRIPSVLAHHRGDDLPFLRDWIAAITASSSAGSAFRSIAARDHLRIRELGVRGHKARLGGGFYLRSWRPPTEFRAAEYYGLSYRHGVGSRFVRDIVGGLRGQ